MYLNEILKKNVTLVALSCQVHRTWRKVVMFLIDARKLILHH